MILSLLLTMLCIILSGCDIQIFEDKNGQGLQSVKKENLKTNVYYVKDSTNFYEVYDCDLSSSGTSLDTGKCAWLTEDEEDMIPTYYSDELIAKTAAQIDTESLTLERYRDTGCSIGVYGAYYEGGYIVVEYNSNTINKTSAYTELKSDTSSHIRIETINGLPVTANMLNDAGVILGMEADKDYEITFYAGTNYNTAIITADTHFLQCFEAYKISDFVMTKNGYEAIYLPDDLKTGYYRIDGSGLFRYMDSVKGAVDIASLTYEDYNDAYYTSEEEQMLVFSQQYTFNLDVITENMSVQATFDPTTVTTTDGIVKMLLTAPDGTQLMTQADKDEGVISCDMKTSIAGKWIVNITPQSMSISDVQIVSNETAAEATVDTYTLFFDNDQTGVIFTMEYEGDGDVTAQVVDENNLSYDMKASTSNSYSNTTTTMEYAFAYLPAGTYTINVYHYPDTNVLKVDYYLSEDTREVEIITFEE